MKPVPLTMLLVCSLLVFSCGEDTLTRYFYKSFFIHETSFKIEGEVFVNDRLTESAEFERIVVRTNAAEDWEIAGVKKEGNKFELMVDVAAPGITLSSETITPDVGVFNGDSGVYGASRFPENFPRCVLIFYVDVRSAKGAIEPEFGTLYYYVYIPKAVDISGSERTEHSGVFGGLQVSEYYYDLDFPQPGWYKIYWSENKPIGNKASYSSGANTKIRTPK
jgi:hypothetical protein